MALRKACKKEYDGHLFDSILECEFYKYMKQQPDIEKIVVHPPLRFPLSTTTYTPDFMLVMAGYTFYVDTKSIWTITEVFKFKKRLIQEQLGIHIDVVLKDKEIDEFGAYLQYMRWSVKYMQIIGFVVWKSGLKKGTISIDA